MNVRSMRYLRSALAFGVDCMGSMRTSTNKPAKPIDLKALSGAINLDAESNSNRYVKMLGMVRGKATAFGPAVEYEKAVEYRIAKLWGIDPKIEVGTIAGTLRVEGEELTCQFGDRFLAARLVGDSFVFSGGYWGNHSLCARFTITTAQRLVAHWRGYCETNVRRYLDNGGVL